MHNTIRCPLILVCAFFTVAIARAQSNYEPYAFSTFAGSAASPRGSADGTGSAARFHFPNGLAVDSAGNVYVTETFDNTIRKITPAAVVTTLAGLAGTTGSEDGIGDAARFRNPYGVAVDSANNIYVADMSNHTIRKITPAGVVSTLAGLAGSSGNSDGSGSAARFRGPAGIAVDSGGNVYVGDANNFTIRKITPGGVVSTLAGLAGSFGSTDGTGTAARFGAVRALAVDSAGNVYAADGSNHTIRKITPVGGVSTLAGLAGFPESVDGTGSAARFNTPLGICVDSAGNVFVGDTNNGTIRKITPTGVVTTLGGDVGFSLVGGSSDGVGSAALFFGPHGVGVNSAGDLYVADSSNGTIRLGTLPAITSPATATAIIDQPFQYQITANGNVTSFNATGLPAGLTVDTVTGVISGTLSVFGSYDITLSATNATRTTTASLSLSVIQLEPYLISTLAGPGIGSADGGGNAARFRSPRGVAVDDLGTVYVADVSNHTIRKITSAGLVSTLAGLARSTGSADGPGATARFNSPTFVAVDHASNVYVADSSNHTIRKITSTGVVSTLAGLAGTPGSVDGIGSVARFNLPRGIGLDSANNLYVAEVGNHTIRKITPAGEVSSFAGLAGSPGSADGSGVAARFNQPTGVTVDSANNIYVADAGNHTLRKIEPSAEVSTVAGSPGNRGGNDGSGGIARFFQPDGIAADDAGNLYVADSVNNTIRKIRPTGFVTTLAGLPDPSIFSVKDGLGINARFNLPRGIAINAAGDLYVADFFGLAIRVGTKVDGGPRIAGRAITARSGQEFSYGVSVTGVSSSATITATDLPAGLSIDSSTGVISGTAPGDGSFSVTLTVTDGNASSTIVFELTFASDPALPVITSPTTTNLVSGEPFSYTITAPNSADPSSDPTTYSYSGTLPDGLSFDPNTGTISGTYPGTLPARESLISPNALTPPGVSIVSTIQIFAKNSHGTTTTTLSFLIAMPTLSHLGNIATRLRVETGDNILIAGFIVTGTEPKRIIVRGIGTSLSLADRLQDPTLELRNSSGALVDSNDNWVNSANKQAIIDTTIPPTNDLESAIVATLPANNSSYTAIVRGVNNGTGIGVVEAYDLDNAVDSKLANISTRGLVQGGDNVLIAGTIVVGQLPQKVLVRAIGPSLSILGKMEDPTLELRDGNGGLIEANDNWQDSPNKQAIIDTTIPPTDDLESAIVATLPANNASYTAIVRGVNGRTGIAVVEVYALQ